MSKVKKAGEKSQSYESKTYPIKVGYINDMTLTANFSMDTVFQAMQLVFDEGLETGVIDRRIEILYREVEGLPKGTVRAVTDAILELVEEGCLAIVGPNISDNSIPAKKLIEKLEIPVIAMSGAEEWMGYWTFALTAGSMVDEPRAWAHLVAKRGLKTVGVVYEQSLVGQTYLLNLRNACRIEGVRILAEEAISQVALDVDGAIKKLYDAKPDAMICCGFGLGHVHINTALAKLKWNPPRYMGTAWQAAYLSDALWDSLLGWVGLDQYDEDNDVGQAFLDKFERRHGYRPAFFMPLLARDLAAILLHAFADSHPLSHDGVRNALERVRLLPTASGARGMRASFGPWMHKGWVGTGYLIAREVEADRKTHRLVDRDVFGDTLPDPKKKGKSGAVWR